MKPLVARLVYCAGLCALAACAAMPRLAPADAPDAPTGIPLQSAAQPAPLANQLAAVVRERAELLARYGDNNPRVIAATAAEVALREEVATAEERDLRREVVSALSAQLAEAMHRRTALSIQYGSTQYGAQHPDIAQAEAVVSALTQAINTEIRNVRSS